MKLFESVPETLSLQIPREQPQIRASPRFGFAGFTLSVFLCMYIQYLWDAGRQYLWAWSICRQLGGTSGDNTAHPVVLCRAAELQGHTN